jgi:hypothetical protein
VTNQATLAHDLLAALGHPIGRLAEEKVSGTIPAWHTATAWIAAWDIEQLVVLRALWHHTRVRRVGQVAGDPVHRAHTAALAGEATAAGVPIADQLLAGWAGAEPVALRTLQLAFSRETSRAQRAYWKHGEKARRDHRTHGERAITHLIC